jgi:hypothetical protein
LLSREDSNLYSLDQNQMCCHYTTGQFNLARLDGFEPPTPGFGDQCSTN